MTREEDEDDYAGPLRRAGEREIDGNIEAFVQKTVTHTRHTLREEFGTSLLDVGNKLSALTVSVMQHQLQSTKEHAEVNARLIEMDLTGRAQAALVQDLVPRVRRLEDHDTVDDARDQERKEILATLIAGRRWLIGTVIAMMAVVVSIVVLFISAR